MNINCKKCNNLFKRSYRTSANKPVRNSASRIFISCLYKNIPLFCIDWIGIELKHITPLDFKLNRVMPHFECERLQKARERGDIMKVEYTIENGIGKNWKDELILI